MDGFFFLKQNSDVAIYGAGALGRQIYERICGNYNVVALLDQKAENLPTFKVPVWKPDISLSKNLGKNVTIIVCVHNGAWHNEIADELYMLGFDRILFLPFFEKFDSQRAFMMKSAYNMWLEEEYEKISCYPIPLYPSMKRKEQPWIRSGEKYVVAYVSAELLYSHHKPFEYEKCKVEKKFEKYLSVPMILLEPYVELFNYLDNGMGDFELYFDFVKESTQGTGRIEKEKLLKDRVTLYKMLECELLQGKSCMEQSPVDVEWNEKGYFNIIDGHHRTVFYFTKKMYKIPVRMRSCDFVKWQSSMASINENIKIGENGCIEKLLLFQRYLGLRNWEKLSFAEIGGYNGYFSYNFYLMGVKNVMLADSRNLYKEDISETYKVPQKTAEIFRVIDIRELKKESEIFNVVCICNAFNVDELDDIVSFLDNNVSDIILWESKHNASLERNYVIANTKFKKYHKLGLDCLSGEEKEIGVFLAE